MDDMCSRCRYGFYFGVFELGHVDRQQTVTEQAETFEKLVGGSAKATSRSSSPRAPA